MKRLIYVVIAVLLISTNLKSQTGWTVYNTGINAVAVGSFFVFNGTNRTVLISYQK